MVLAALGLDRLTPEEREPTGASGPASPSATSQPAPQLNGRLVYLGGGGPGRSRLWVLGLLSGEATIGPRPPGRLTELVDASGARRGWIGVETRERDGATSAQVLDGLSPDATARRLATGDVVAWGPSGTMVVVGRNGTGPQICASVVIDVVSVRTGSISSGIAPGAVCGPVLSLGRSAAANYLSAFGDDGYGLYVTGTVGVPHLLFARAGLLSSSALSAFLLEPRTERGPAKEPATILRWRGTGGPVRFEVDGEPLATTRVLAWSPDGLRAAVLGTVGFRAGVYLLEVEPGRGAREPVFVTRTTAADATFASDGSLYVVARGRLLRFADGALGEVGLPEGAPAPAGPILWVP